MRQGASLDRKKLMADPIMVTTIVVLIAFLTLFILYPLAILLVDSFYGQKGFSLDTFRRILAMSSFRTAIWNTLKGASWWAFCLPCWDCCLLTWKRM